MADWWDDFEQDWSDVTSGNWTMDEISSGQDITGNAEIGYFDGLLLGDYSNEGKNYPTTESTQGAGGSPVNASMASMSGLSGLLKAITGGSGTSAQMGSLLPLLAGLYSANQPNTTTVRGGYQGTIPRYTATRTAPAAGQRLSGNVAYTAKAEGGEMRSGGFVIPADVVSHFGNGSSDAGLKLLASKLGATPIKGKGDGMSDSIPASIDGEQPALVAHEEAYLSPEQVKRAGGAKKLRAMMNRIREARTGSTEQGRKINPDKFMPGGSVQRYAAGDTVSTGLAGWVAPYVTDTLAKGQALAEMPYEAYTGPLTAGPSALQTQAFGQAAGLQTPASIGQAATTAGGIASAAQGMTGYAPGQFTNQFAAPQAYQTGQFDTGTFGAAEAQKYMNPYIQAALDPQLQELQRQNKLANLADMGKLTKAGAYGGGRQAVLTAENTRNLMDKINEATRTGYSTAYDKAVAQFNAEQARNLEAQKAAEASRQFGATQGLTSAQSAAQYGQSAAEAAEKSRQFGAAQGLQGLQTALQAAQAQGQLGQAQSQSDIAGLKALADLGTTQRGIAAEDVAAQKAAFEEARLNPYKMVQFQQSLLSGLPLTETSTTSGTNNLSQFAQGYTTLQQALKALNIG